MEFTRKLKLSKIKLKYIDLHLCQASRTTVIFVEKYLEVTRVTGTYF